MQCSNSIEVAPNAQKSNSPLEELEGAVAFGKAWEVLEHKQMKLKMLQDQCKKNFAN